MPNVYPTNIIGGLPELRWRTLRAPCSEITCDFSHTQAARAYAYIDDEGHDNTGRSAFRIGATLHFLNTLEDGLYPAGWRLWLDAILDGSSDDLVHPDIGEIRARVLSGSFKIVATERAGITVRVEWTSTVDNIDQPNTVTGADVALSQLAEEADAAMLLLGLNYPSGEGSGSLSEGINGISGSLQSASTSVAGKVTSTISKIDKLSGTIDQLHDSATALNDAAVAPFLFMLEAMSEGLTFLREKVALTDRPTAEFVATSSTTLDAFARQVGNTVAEVVLLNRDALGRPDVPKGTALRYYKAA
jgi:hypothetical protein